MRKPTLVLPSAPLAYVLAEVRFATIVDLAKRARDTQDAIRERFPRSEPITGISVAANASPSSGYATPESVQFYNFTNLERTAAVVLSPSGLSYNVTDYQTFDTFSEDLAWLFSRLSHVLQNDLVERCGLRYVDVVLPRENESLFDYVAGPIRAIFDSESPRAQMVIEFPREQGGLAVRLLSLNAPLYLSPDILQISLVAPRWIQSAQAAGLNTGILDMDRWHGASQKYSESSLLETFKTMHDDLKRMFERMSTDHAIDVWSQSRPDVSAREGKV